MGKSSKRRGGNKVAKSKPPKAPGQSRQSNNNGKSSPSRPQPNSTTTYGTYKQKTRAFRDGLANILPVDFSLAYVSDLGRGAEYIFKETKAKLLPRSKPKTIKKSNQFWIQNSLLSDLEASIKLRETLTITYIQQGEGDQGHQYMLDMLKYCQQLLLKCKDLLVVAGRSKASSTAEKGEVIATGGQFAALSIDDADADDGGDDEKAEEEEWENIPSTIAEGKPTEPNREYSVEEDLIEGSYRNQALFFLYTIDVLFSNINHQFKLLKMNIQARKNADNLKKDEESVLDGSQAASGYWMVNDLLSMTALTNLSLDAFEVFEQSFYLDCPHFSSFYHVLAALVFYEAPFVQDLHSKIAPSITKKSPTILLDHLANCIEAGFRTPVDRMFWGQDARNVAFAKAVGLPLEDVTPT